MKKYIYSESLYLETNMEKCEECGELFIQKTDRSKYCSTKCYNKQWYKERKERRKEYIKLGGIYE